MLDYYFDAGISRITDSMTEPQFRTLLSYVISKINCGHTSIRYSKEYADYMDTCVAGSLPAGTCKIWDDTMLVYSNLNRRESMLNRGTVIRSINGMPPSAIDATACFDFWPPMVTMHVSQIPDTEQPRQFRRMVPNVFGR